MPKRAYVVAEERGDLEPESSTEPRRAESPVHLVTEEPSLLVSVPHQSSREVSALVLLSVLLHAGAAWGIYNQEPTPPERHASKVDIEFARPPEPPPKATPPPPPPPPPVEQSKPLAKPEAAAPDPTPPAEDQSTNTGAAEDAPADTGSSAEAADDGNLIAGKGGLGVAPPPPPPAPKAEPAPVIAAHEGANYSKNPRPGYPRQALRDKLQGEVLLRVQVLPNGRAGFIKVHKTSGHSVLDDAALAAIRNWSFVPARQGGEPVAGWVTVPIVFRLQ